MFWNITWRNKKGEKVKYGEVKEFYKKLKRYDKNHSEDENYLTKASRFLDENEKIVAIPYQELREAVKNHSNTKSLVLSTRAKYPNSDIYLSFFDRDTISFNGVYSAYLRIHKQYDMSPTIMSTGYEFSEERIGADYPFVEYSKLDRKIRIETAEHFALGTYYPEPNFCVFILPQFNTVTESFIDQRKSKEFESPALISAIIVSRGNIIAVFNNDNPLITTIPTRARFYKEKPIKFSKGFMHKLQPTEKDVDNFNKIAQSKTDSLKFAKSLYVNKAFRLVNKELGNVGKFNKGVCKLLKCKKDDEQTAISNLSNHTDEKNNTSSTCCKRINIRI